MLTGCVSWNEEIEGASITKTVSLLGILTPTSLSIGPSYTMRALLSSDCRAIIIGETDFTLAELSALCDGESNETE